MNVQSYSVAKSKSVYNPNFQGNPLSQITAVIPGTKVCKNLTKLDVAAIQSYVLAKPYKIGITAGEVAELSKYEGNDFIINSYNLICEKLGLIEAVRPQLCMTSIQRQTPLVYSPLEKIIFADTKKVFEVSNNDKAKVFAAVRHEVQHFLQHADILRHETLGEEATQVMASLFVKEQIAYCKILLANNSVEQIIQSGICPDKKAESILLEIKNCLDNNDQKGLNEVAENMKNAYKVLINQLRTNIILTRGVIKADSSLTPKIKNDFDVMFYKSNYYNPDGSVRYDEYFNCIEQEAIQAQVSAQCEYLQQPCFIKFYKDETIKTLKDENLMKQVREIDNKFNKKVE